MTPRAAWESYSAAVVATRSAWSAVEAARDTRSARLLSRYEPPWTEGALRDVPRRDVWQEEDDRLLDAWHAAEKVRDAARATFCGAVANACPDSIGDGVRTGDLRAWRPSPDVFALVALIVDHREVAVVSVPWATRGTLHLHSESG